MKRLAAKHLGILAAASALGTASCNLVAGLDQFHRGSSSSGGGGAGSSSSATSSTHATGGTSSSGVTSSKSSASSGSTGSSMCATHVLINEAYLPSQTTSEFVELFNPTNAMVDLSTYELDALENAGSLGAKWKGSVAPLAIPPGGYLFLEYGTMYPNADATMNAIARSKDPTVIVLYDGATIVDSLCICSNPSGCSFTQGQELCGSHELLSTSFHSTSNTQGASRTTCVDNGNASAEFMLACPTPGMPNASMTCP